MKLTDLDFDKNAIIVALPKNGILKDKLIEMGLAVGYEITAIRKSPLGNPIEYAIQNYRFFIRREDANHIIVEES